MDALPMHLMNAASMDHTARVSAGQWMDAAREQPGFGSALISIVKGFSQRPELARRAAIQLMNLLKYQWAESETAGVVRSILPDSEKVVVRPQLLDLLLQAPTALHSNLEEAVLSVAHVSCFHTPRDTDPRDRWPDFIPQILQHIQTFNPVVVSACFGLVDRVFMRFRHASDNEEIVEELKNVLDTFALPMTTVFKKMLELLPSVASNPQQLSVVLQALTGLVSSFRSLNTLVVPAVFDDHLEQWMDGMHSVLENVTAFASVVDPEGLEVGPLEKCLTEICGVASLFASKHEDEFNAFWEKFTPAMNNVLQSAGTNTRGDALAVSAINFLSTTAKSVNHKIFGSPEMMNSIFTHVILPNIKLREVEQDIFMDEPYSYIRQDAEGGDLETRRRAATDLVRSLCKFYESDVHALFTKHVGSLLAEFKANPDANWASKDAAIYIVTALSTRSSSSAAKATGFPGVIDFLNEHVMPDLQMGLPGAKVTEANVSKWILRSSCLRFLSVMRTTIPLTDPAALTVIFTIILNHLRATSVVTVSYAAILLEHMLGVKNPNGTPVIQETSFAPFAPSIMIQLLAVISSKANNDFKENEYLMSSALAVVRSSGSTLIPQTQDFLNFFADACAALAKSPSNPGFTYFLFETLGCLTRKVGEGNPSGLAAIEAQILSPMQGLVSEETVEYLPFALQIITLLLDLGTGEVGTPYKAMQAAILPSITGDGCSGKVELPGLWGTAGAGVPALVRFLQTMCVRGASANFSVLTAVFRRLNASTTTDHLALQLATTIWSTHPYEPTAFRMGYVKQIFARLSKLKTTSYMVNSSLFISFMCQKYTPQAVILEFSNIKPQLVHKFTGNIWGPNVGLSKRRQDRKHAVLGIATYCVSYPTDPAGPTLMSQAVKLANLHANSVDSNNSTLSYARLHSSGFKSLKFAGTRRCMGDMFPEVSDPRAHLVAAVNHLTTNSPAEAHALLGSLGATEAANLESWRRGVM